MRSYTFNSEFAHHRAPQSRWGLLWILTAILTASAVAGAEVFWRSQNHEPSVVDSIGYWAFQRSKCSDNDASRVVLLGASRIQTGFSIEEFRERFPNRKITQLAVAGTCPVATLQDLANDEDFRGLVILDVTAQGLDRQYWNEQAEYVQHYRDRCSLNNSIDSACAAGLQSLFVSLSAHLKLDRILRRVITGDSLPEPAHVVMYLDRSRKADYSRLDIDAVNARYLENKRETVKQKPTASDRWLSDFREIDRDIRRIQDRGGNVVLVRFPTSGESWEIDEGWYPRRLYWDRMAEVTSAETIHFKDVPRLDRFVLPDMSHLNYQDKAAFTGELLSELEKRGVM